VRLFLDTAEMGEIRTAARWGVLNGVTTTRPYSPKVGGSYDDVPREICAITPGLVSAEVVAEDVEGMHREGRRFAKPASSIVVKVAMSAEGLEAIRRLAADAHSARDRGHRVDPAGSQHRQREAVAALQQAVWTAFPDARVDLVTRVASADAVISEEVLSGTHTGPFATPAGTLPPSGRAVRMPFVTVQQIRNGKIAAERIYFDQLDFSASWALLRLTRRVETDGGRSMRCLTYDTRS
jgi:steroid delta-isomerase-like uncharacterized protein